MEIKKGTAILLAVFFGFWSWLYTYQRDAWKFWLCFAINLFFFSPVVFLWNINVQGQAAEGRDYALIGGMILFIPVFFGLWFFAVIDAVIKTPQRYNDSGKKSKVVTVFLAFLFGPFSWFYTYHQDKWKFWVSFVFLVVSIIVIPRLATFNIFPTIKEIYKAGYVDLKLPFSERLSYFFHSNFSAYLTYYKFENIKIISFLVPAIVWLGAVISSILRIIHWKSAALQTVKQDNNPSL